MSLTNTIVKEPTYRFLTEKIKAGKNHKLDLGEILNYTGLYLKQNEYILLSQIFNDKDSITIFLHNELNLTPCESVLLVLPLESEATSLIYKNLSLNKRMVFGDTLEESERTINTDGSLKSVQSLYTKYGV